MSAANVLAAAASGNPVAIVASIIPSGPSPRFEGGPLQSGVNAGLARIAAGGAAAQTELDNQNRIRVNDKNAKQWQDVWVNLTPGAIKDKATAQYYVQLDPSGASRISSTLLTAPTGALPQLPPGV